MKHFVYILISQKRSNWSYEREIYLKSGIGREEKDKIIKKYFGIV